ncbi:MAG: tyrosine-type recombinase/integrase, partial [Verrucomicrobiota bacterium]
SGEWKGLFFLGLYTGQRLNDLAELHWHNVDLMTGTISFTAGKTGAVVALPLMDAAREALLELPGRADPNAKLFPGIAGRARGTRSQDFHKLLAKVGLARPLGTKGEIPGQRVSAELCFHSLRHTATSMLKSAGVSQPVHHPHPRSGRRTQPPRRLGRLGRKHIHHLAHRHPPLVRLPGKRCHVNQTMALLRLPPAGQKRLPSRSQQPPPLFTAVSRTKAGPWNNPATIAAQKHDDNSAINNYCSIQCIGTETHETIMG